MSMSTIPLITFYSDEVHRFLIRIVKVHTFFHQRFTEMTKSWFFCHFCHFLSFFVIFCHFLSFFYIFVHKDKKEGQRTQIWGSMNIFGQSHSYSECLIRITGQVSYRRAVINHHFLSVLCHFLSFFDDFYHIFVIF